MGYRSVLRFLGSHMIDFDEEIGVGGGLERQVENYCRCHAAFQCDLRDVDTVAPDHPMRPTSI